jgi:hypothetical protein
MKDLQEIVCAQEIVGIPTGTNEAGGYLAASSIIHDIRAAFGPDAAIECLQVFTLCLCNSHDKPIEFYLHFTNASNTAFIFPTASHFEAKHFYYYCDGNWQ